MVARLPSTLHAPAAHRAGAPGSHHIGRQHDAVDLRRRRRRDVVETIVDNARWALPSDRAVVHAIYREGMTASDLARAMDTSPRIVRRRTRQLASRLLSERFAFVVANRDAWPPGRRRVATACILQGRTMRAAARHLKMSFHAVRKHMDVVHALFETAG